MYNPLNHGVCSRYKARSLRNPGPARRGRDGRGLSRARHQAWARRGAESFARQRRSRPGSHGTLRARSAGAGVAQSSEHRGDLRPRGIGRRARAGYGIGGGADFGGASGKNETRNSKFEIRNSARVSIFEFRSSNLYLSPNRSPKRSKRRTNAGSFTAT